MPGAETRLPVVALRSMSPDFGMRRAANLVWQEFRIDKEARARIKDQKPCVLWFTGLSGAGKSTIANLVDRCLYALGRHAYLLDGDNVRHAFSGRR